MSRDIVLYALEKGIGRITLNRPEVLNALSKDVLIELASIIKEINKDDDVRAVIITGAGDRAFSAGADIQFLNKATPIEIRELAKAAVDVNSMIENLGKPVVAAINGYALGGGLELAEACTLRISIRDARMGHPEVRIGAIAGWGGTTRLPRLIGKGRAAEMLLTGRQITAEEAFQHGLINKVVEKEWLLPEAEKMLEGIISNAPLAVKMTWETLHRGLNMTLEESAMLGVDNFGLIASTEDFRQGTKAFLEKTEPSYSGR
jgi:enoyl-CoA hydratase